MIADWTWVQLLTAVSGLYALAIAVFLIRDNRRVRNQLSPGCS